MESDWSLLEEWARSKSDEAFSELVRRHSGFVYASALRQLRDPALADEVTQGVFQLLAQKAATFREGIILPNWLFRATRFIAAKTQRAARRRQKNEMEAAMMIYSEGNSEADETWRQIAPHLDEALAALPETDREAMLLRFFQEKRLREVGEALGLSEEAAKKRVSRGLEKMRHWLNKRSLPISTTALALALTGRYADAAPLSVIANAKAAARVKGAAIVHLNFFSIWTKLAIGGAAIVFVGLLSISRLQTSSPNPAPKTELARASEVKSSATGPTSVAVTKEPHLRIRFREKGTGNTIPTVKITANGEELIADESGAEISFPEPLDPVVHLEVNAPNYVRIYLSWNRHEFAKGPIDYTCFLERGGALRGTIQNEAGLALSDAKLVALFVTTEDRENIGRLEFQSDAAGHFESSQLPVPGEDLNAYTVWITHPEYRRGELRISGRAQFESNQTITLQSGVIVRGIVLDENDVPLPGVSVSESDAGTWPGFSVVTEANGAFTLGAYEEGKNIVLNLWQKGFRPTTQLVEVKKGEPAMYHYLRHPEAESELTATTIRIYGSVRDEKTGQAIEDFKVYMFFNETRTLHFLLGDGRNGAFDWTLDRRNQEGYVLGFEAPGYIPGWSDFRKVCGEPQEFRIALRPGLLRQQVVSGDGTRLAGAEVQLWTSLGWGGTGAFTKKSSHSRTQTDSAGWFSLQPNMETRGIAVTNETSFAIVSMEQAEREPIRLQPFSSIEGEFLVSGQPASGRCVLLHLEATPSNSLLGTLQVTETTDESGRFRFARLPSGTYRVSEAQFSPFGRPVNVTLLPGQTGQVRLEYSR